MVIEVGHVRAAILDHEIREAVAHTSTATPEGLAQLDAGHESRSVVVEYHHRIGGLPQRGMLGGTWSPDASGKLSVEVRISAPSTADQRAPYRGALGRDFVLGLPDEYRDAVSNTLLNSGLGAGLLVVDRAAHDLVESSVVAFRATASLLAAALSADSAEDREEAVRSRLEAIGAESAWPDSRRRS